MLPPIKRTTGHGTCAGSKSFNPEAQSGSFVVLTKLALTWGNFMWPIKKKNNVFFLPSSMFTLRYWLQSKEGNSSGFLVGGPHVRLAPVDASLRFEGLDTGHRRHKHHFQPNAAIIHR